MKNFIIKVIIFIQILFFSKQLSTFQPNEEIKKIGIEIIKNIIKINKEKKRK